MSVISLIKSELENMGMLALLVLYCVLFSLFELNSRIHNAGA